MKTRKKKLLRTGEVIERSGLSRQSFYQYLSMGLIWPQETSEGGRYRFSEEVLGRLEIISQLKETGYTLRDIKEIFFKEEKA